MPYGGLSVSDCWEGKFTWSTPSSTLMQGRNRYCVTVRGRASLVSWACEGIGLDWTGLDGYQKDEGGDSGENVERRLIGSTTRG